MEANLEKEGLSKDRKQCRDGEGEAGEVDHKSLRVARESLRINKIHVIYFC